VIATQPAASTFLEAHEVVPVLEQIAERLRPFFATAIYSGLRKGELIGLRKSDVDLTSRLLVVRSSYDRTTKGAHEEAIPIAAPSWCRISSALSTSRAASSSFPDPTERCSASTLRSATCFVASWGALAS
jgi:integrase